MDFFRDDIIFVVYLFQRWKYPTDMTRPNEYGQVFEEKTSNTTAETQEGDAAKPADQKKTD